VITVAAAVGTRPEAIKMAPVLSALAACPDACRVRLCVTAQHRHLLDQVLRLFDLHAERDLDLMTADQDLADLTGRALAGVRGWLRETGPDVLLVQGDTTTAFAAALAAFYADVPVGHVEAGLRTGDLSRPYPEEANRRLIDALATHLYAPTAASRDNLLREGAAPERILVTGNTTIDALRQVLASPRAIALPSRFPAGRRGILVTLHRRESFGAPLRAAVRALRRLAASRPDVHLVFPVHPNPNVRREVAAELAGIPNVALIEPLPYDEFARLMADCALIVTDSGGIQEESTAVDRPVVIVRDVTERPEVLATGRAVLAGTDEERIVAEAGRLLDAPPPAGAPSAAGPFGDGLAARRIVAHLLRAHGAGAPFPDPGEWSAS
jgi:UDP-N-acetylglucosamine 2-epimerase (non-hydrolysing)